MPKVEIERNHAQRTTLRIIHQCQMVIIATDQILQFQSVTSKLQDSDYTIPMPLVLVIGIVIGAISGYRQRSN